MLQRLVANWLRQQAQDRLVRELRQRGERDDDTIEHHSVDMVLIFPSAAEAGGFVDQLSGVTTTNCAGYVERIGSLGELSLAVVESPSQRAQLAVMVRDVIRLHSPRWVVATGFCHATSKDLRPGAILMASQFVDASGYTLASGLRVDANQLSSGVHCGPLMSVTAEIAADAPTRSALGIDQQAAVIAEVCRLQQTRMLAVHVVASVYGRGDSPFVQQMKKQRSFVGKLGAAAGALIEQPGTLKQLLGDKEKTLRLSDRLAGFLVGVLEQLKASEL